MKVYYTYCYRLNQIDSYLIWYDDKIDGVVINEAGRIPVFRKKDSLFAYASNLRIFIDGTDPFLTDLDRVKKWLDKPDTNTVDCAEFLNAWNLFGDVAVSVSDSKFDQHRDKTNKIYQKLFYGNNIPAVTPEGENYKPSWTKVEVELIRETLAYGLNMFQKHIITVEG